MRAASSANAMTTDAQRLVTENLPMLKNYAFRNRYLWEQLCFSWDDAFSEVSYIACVAAKTYRNDAGSWSNYLFRSVRRHFVALVNKPRRQRERVVSDVSKIEFRHRF